MNKIFLFIATILGALAVISGAMLAHQWRNRMSADVMEIYETAVRYQFYHVFALMATGILSERFHNNRIRWAGVCFISGILLFCGSLYFISAILMKEGTVPILLGICTPLGGVSFILGWIFLGTGILKGGNS
jgi:uncharacterized membrane protein YgdD (TMEM256/DUF423 family)